MLFPSSSNTLLGEPKWVVPFLNTSPLWDLRFVIWLFPIWWLIGIEQFIWPITTAVIALKLTIQRKGQIILVRPLIYLTAFILIYLLSASAVSEPSRFLTFGRTFGAYITLFAVIFIVTNCQPNQHQRRQLLTAVAGILFLSTLIGFVAIIGIWRPIFPSTLGLFLPNWIAETSYGGQIALRTVGRLNWFVGIGRYFRVNGFFLYATMYAATLAMFLPIAAYLFATARHTLARWFYITLIALMGLNLAFTTGRIAIIGFLCGWAFYLTWYARLRPAIRLVAIVGIFSLIVITLSGWIVTDKWLIPVDEWVTRFAFARGEGSFTDRLQVYQYTLEGISQRPLLGWATEQDVESLRYPLGSHSYYLGILFKQGVLGFLALLAFIGSVWRYICQGHRLAIVKGLYSDQKFLEFAIWSLVAVAINSLTDALDLDTTTFFILSLIIALVVNFPLYAMVWARE